MILMKKLYQIISLLFKNRSPLRVYPIVICIIRFSTQYANSRRFTIRDFESLRPVFSVGNRERDSLALTHQSVATQW